MVVVGRVGREVVGREVVVAREAVGGRGAVAWLVGKQWWRQWWDGGTDDGTIVGRVAVMAMTKIINSNIKPSFQTMSICNLNYC